MFVSFAQMLLRQQDLILFVRHVFCKELAAWTWHVCQHRFGMQQCLICQALCIISQHYQHLPTVAMSMSCTAPKKCRSGLPGTAGDTGESHAKACPDPQKQLRHTATKEVMNGNWMKMVSTTPDVLDEPISPFLLQSKYIKKNILIVCNAL